MFEPAHQITPYPLNQRRLLIKKIADRLQQRLKPHALPHQLKIGKAHLVRRQPRHGSTQRAENHQVQADRCAAHPADNIGRLLGVATNHLSIREHHAPHWQVKLAAEKRWKCPFRRSILPFATETRLVHPSGIEGLIFWLLRLRYPARGFPA
jgi:hypothetical protein